MATLQISLSGSAVINGSKSYTLTDADVQTLISYMQTKFATANSDGSTTPLTAAQALLAWANDWVSSTRDEIRSRALTNAKQQAADQVSVPPIVFS